MLVGRIVGHYQVLEKVGEGGMGEVYKARDTRLNRLVAIKSLPPDRIADPERRARFIREARAASALNHPNIVTVHDIVTEDGCDYIVMEYVAGDTLTRMIARNELRPAQILKYAIQIATVLARAHAAGIVHRDLKPSNIMVAPEGDVKVLDFGLAKFCPASPGPDAATETIERTLDGVVVGTVGYMSPEQVKGRPIDHRSDIFSFGVVLYEMLSGRRPFPGDSAIEVMTAILKEEPPDLPDTVHAGLRQIVAGCLEKNSSLRFESARDLVFALRALSANSSAALPAPATASSAPVRKPRWMVPLLMLAILLAGLSAALYLTRPAPLDLSAYRFKPLATDAEPETSGVWSRDGKSIAYLKVVDGREQVMLRNLDAPSPVQLTRFPSGVYSWAAPFFSPDAGHVYFIAEERLWTVAVVGGEPRVVLAAPMQAAALSPDGKTLAFWQPYEESGKQYFSVWTSSPPGAPPRKYEPAPFRMEAGVYPNYLRFSPDGSRLGLSTWRVGGEAWFWVLPWPDGPNVRPYQPFPANQIHFPASFDWMADSRHVCIAPDLSLWMGDTSSGKLQRLTATTSGFAMEPSITPDAKRILFASGTYETDIVELPLDGSPPRPLLATARSESSPSWSAAGDVMAFITDRSGESEIWLRSPEGGWERPAVRQRDFPNEAGQLPFNASLSPDGTRIACTRRSRQWISAVSGGRAVLATPGDVVETGVPSWSPDSSSIAYFGIGGGRMHVAVARMSSQEPPFFVPGTADQCASAPVWSPDGRWIACGGPGQSVLLVSPDGKQRRTLPSPVRAAIQDFVLVWSRDAESIYIASSLSPKARLDVIHVRTGESRRIAEYQTPLSFRTVAAYSLSGSLSRDGKTIATTVFNTRSDLWILEGFPPPR